MNEWDTAYICRLLHKTSDFMTLMDKQTGKLLTLPHEHYDEVRQIILQIKKIFKMPDDANRVVACKNWIFSFMELQAFKRDAFYEWLECDIVRRNKPTVREQAKYIPP